MSKQIEFKDIRVGDKIKAVTVYPNGDHSERTFTVTSVSSTTLEGYNFAYYGWYPPTTFTLLDRPVTKPVVGDHLTPEQVWELPEGAVFTRYGNPRLVIWNRKAVSVNGATSRLCNYDETAPEVYHLVFLPETI